MGIRDTSSYGWVNTGIYPSLNSVSGTVTNAKYFDVSVDSSGTIFVVGQATDSAFSSSFVWLVSKSVDNGKTFQVIDRVYDSGGSAITEPNIANCIAIDSNDIIYVGGKKSLTGDNGQLFTIRRSGDHGTSWATVFTSGSIGSNLEASVVSMDINSNNVIYAIGYLYSGSVARQASLIVSSSLGTSGSWAKADSYFQGPASAYGMAIACDPSNANKIYASVNTGAPGATDTLACVRSSSDGGVTWNNGFTVDNSPFGVASLGNPGGLSLGSDIVVDKNGGVYCLFTSGSSLIRCIFKSPTGASGTFNTKVSRTVVDAGGSNLSLSVVRARSNIDSLGNIYLSNQNNTDSQFDLYRIFSSSDSNSDFVHVDFSTPSTVFSPFTKGKITRVRVFNDKVYQTCFMSDPATNNAKALLRIGKMSVNSGSIGPRMLATFFGFVRSEISGTITEGFNLNNISEFPHSSGLFQMKNLVLGTFSQGRVGKTDDSIIQKRFIGSFVRVLFPKQDDASDIKGYDAAKKPGKLTTDWVWGDSIDVEKGNYDHLALNCSILKQVSGTLDSVLIRIESKPIGDSGYFIDQTTTVATSGSFVSETTYRDEIHSKPIDYGDLTIAEVGWKIDQDLTNVKSLRIACKQKNGQNDDKNKLLIVIGRFITKSKEHQET